MADNKQYVVDKPVSRSMSELADMSTCIVVDGLPIVTNVAAVNKLRDVVFRMLETKKCSPKMLELVLSEAGASLGYAFLEYENRKDADNALTTLNNIPFDRTHRLRVNAWADFDLFLTVDATSVNASSSTTESTALHALLSFDDPYRWLQDTNAREQYLMKSGNQYNVEVYWNDPHMSLKRECIIGSEAANPPPPEWTTHDKQRSRVLKDFPCWSPLGTYVVSLDTEGIRLWVQVDGKWQCLLRFDHPNVTKFSFSPKEKYLVTGCRKQCTLWDVRLGKFINSFAIGAEDKSWPVFHWNFDESMFAQQLGGTILLFNVKTLVPTPIQLGKDMNISFVWSPVSSHFIYSSVQQAGDQNLKVVMEELSTTQRKEMAVRNLFGVQSTELVWREKGSYCACIINMKAQRPDKVDIFRVSKGADASVEQIEVVGTALNVCWDPSGLYGARFCVVSSMKKGIKCLNMITFFHVTQDGIRTVDTLRNRYASKVSWSPSGGHAVTLDPNGALEFISIGSDGITSLQVVEQGRQQYSTWDPSGRYFISCVTMQSTSELDLGFSMFNFLGQRIYHETQIPKFSHLLWRPRPATLLTNSAVQNILRTLNKRMEQYEKDEEARRFLDAENARKLNEECRNRYFSILQSIRESFKSKTKEREKKIEKLYKNAPSFNLVKRVREEVVSYI